MKKLGKKLIAGTAFAVAAAATAGCGSGPPSVYGPPEYFEQESESTVPEETTINNNFNPGGEIPEAVYGPPEWFEPSSENLEGVYGPPSYDPSTNIPEDVYGPPEYFENQN